MKYLITLFLITNIWALNYQDYCKRIKGNNRYFYEDNRTYRNSNELELHPFEMASPEDVGLNSNKLKGLADDLSNDRNVFSLLVAKDNKLVYEEYFNGAKENDSNNIHSASKTILMLLTGIALDKGHLSNIDEKVKSYFTADKKGKTTLRYLLEMRSGHKWVEDRYEYRVQRKKNWINAILSYRQRRPGRRFKYSTGNSHVLGGVLAKATNKSLCEFALEELFSKMGILPERWGIDPNGFYSGGFNLFLTARELTKIGMFIANNGKLDNDQIVSKGWIQNAFKPSVYRQYGRLIWLQTIGSKKYYVMWGYGNQMVYIRPKDNLVVVMTSNTRYDNQVEDSGLHWYIKRWF